MRLSFINSRNVNWCIHCGKQFGGASESYTELPYGPAISFLGIYPREMKA